MEAHELKMKTNLVKNATRSYEDPAPKDLGDGVGDPVVVRTKGTGRGNKPVGSRRMKRRKCNTCGELGHRRTKCRNSQDDHVRSSQETHGKNSCQVEFSELFV
ncbi:hypothetical protein PIB30_087698 [Stylosanthes scabra]|uniref:CCHC-type domain-containing protein n=1 Tax=Stylosanthes scabra TaxID=79078 RepID=A0ABU6UVX0_9FABA|nr:hypothetical protein [Stylosanthes scabra]